jgi:hypothetical protein
VIRSDQIRSDQIRSISLIADLLGDEGNVEDFSIYEDLLEEDEDYLQSNEFRSGEMAETIDMAYEDMHVQNEANLMMALNTKTLFNEEAPWQVSIGTETLTGDAKNECNGAFLNRKFVITGGKCVKKLKEVSKDSNLMIRAHTIGICKTNKDAKMREMPVANIQYGPDDIALLRVSKVSHLAF